MSSISGIIWENALDASRLGESTGELAISAVLWSIFLTFVLYGKYEISFLTAVVASPILVVSGAVTIYVGVFAFLQLLIVLVVPALVLFFLFGWIPITVGYSG
jgi:hypothetical protein